MSRAGLLHPMRWRSMRSAAVIVLTTALAIATHPDLRAQTADVPTAARLALPFVGRGVDIASLPVAPSAPPTATASATSSPSPSPSPTPSPDATSTPTPTLAPTAAPTPAVAVDGPRITTAHYDLHVEPGVGLDGADIGRFVESAYPQLAAFFGAEPPVVGPTGRLPGKIFGSSAAMAAAMAADGITYGGGGGYYHPANRTFYAFAQPSAFFTRMLILHEATHQFHYLSATGNQGYSGFWYGEGLAEHFGMHNWDGTRLALGIVPAISLEDYPAQALAEFDARDRDLAALVADRAGWTRPSGWGVVSWLIDERPAEARALFDRLNRRENLVTAWTAVFGPVDDADAAAYRAWLTRHQQPWREVWRAFEQRGDALIGASGVNAIAVRKWVADAQPDTDDDDPASAPLAVSLEPLAGPLRAGIIVGYTDAAHFVVVQLLASRDIWAFRMSPAGWQWLAGARAPDADPGRAAGRDVLEARPADGGGWTVAVNGADVITVPDEGLVGLNVDGCTVEFRPLPAR